MKNKIQTLFENAKQTKTCLRELWNQIKGIPGAEEWIDEHCDPELTGRFIAKKIYSALNDGCNFVCSHGNPIILNERYFLTYPKKTRNLCGCYDEFLKSSDVVTRKSIARARYESTMIQRYGSIASLDNPEIRQKFHETNLKKYGAKYPAQNKDIHAKKNQTCLEKYGCEYPIQNSEISKQIKQTNLQRYSAESPLGSESIKEKIRKQNELMGASYAETHR